MISFFFILIFFFSSAVPSTYGLSSIMANDDNGDTTYLMDALSFSAQQVNIQKEYWAVLVAINAYGGSFLPYSINEITQFKNTLLDGGNWKESNILMLTDEEATINGIITSIEWLESNADENDVSLFYFVGHGKKSGDTESIIAYGGSMTDLELDQHLDRINGTVVTILDSCYSGGFIDELKQRGRIVLTACAADENTYQVRDLESGIFGYYLNLTLESYTKFAEGTYLLTWLFSVSYSQKLSKQYNESYTIHPQIYDGTLTRTRLINHHSYFNNVFSKFIYSLSFSKENSVFRM